jgi:DNA-binding MarR family transcriptional regulator
VNKVREGGFLISKIKQISGRIFDKKLKDCDICDLNAAQGRIIFSLWQRDQIPIQELSRLTALGKTTLTAMLRRLEDTGHITRWTDGKDKRKTVVSLTQKSMDLKEKYNAVSQEMLAMFYRGLTEDQIDAFEETLRHVLFNLMQYEEENK